jgi:hypothetical protein
LSSLVHRQPTFTANGIVWVVRQDASGHAVLHAFDATKVNRELYNSSQAGSRDAFVNSTLRQTPVFVVNGKAYVQVDGYLAVFGLLQ